MSKIQYSLLVFIGGCSYGVVSTFVKLAYKEGFTVNEITGVHYFFGITLLWLAALFVPKPKLTLKQWLIFIISGLPLGFTGIFYNHSLEYINASFAIVLLLQFTWISALLLFIFDRVLPSTKTILAITVILAGSILASGVIQHGITFSLEGMIFGLLAATSFASFLFITSHNKTPLHPIFKSAIMSIGAAILVLSIMPPTFLFTGALFTGLTKYGLAVSLFGLLLPAVLFNIGMPKVGNLGSILSASELPMAIFMSSIVLHETVSLVQWLGVFVILLGIALPNLRKN